MPQWESQYLMAQYHTACIVQYYPMCVQAAGLPRGGSGGQFAPTKGGPPKRRSEADTVYKLYRERCLKNWIHFKVCGKMT